MKKIFIIKTSLAAIMLTLLLSFSSSSLRAQTYTTIASGVNMVNTGVTYDIPFGFFVDNGSYTDTVSPGAMNVTGGVTFSGSGTTKEWNLNFLTSGTNDMTAAGVQVYNTATLNSGVSLNAGAAKLYLRTDDYLTTGPAFRFVTLVNNGLLTGTVNGLSLYVGGVDYRTATTSGTCPYAPVLSLNISGSSMAYQWQKSTDNVTFNPVAGATNATYTPTVTAVSYYRCALSTSNTAYTQNTPSVQLTPTGLPTIGISITTNPICPPVNTGWPHVVGGTTTLTGTGGAPYTWAPATGLSATSGTSVTVSNLSSTTTYTVTGTSGGCSNTATKQVTVNTAPTTTITGAHYQGLCYWFGPNTWSTKPLAATGATTYTWSPNVTLSATTGSAITCTSHLLPSYARTYTVTGTSNGCKSDDTVKVETVDLQVYGSPNENPSIYYFPGQTINVQMIALNFFNYLCGYGVGDSVNYTWAPTTGITGANSFFDTLNVTPAGTPTYTITGTYLGCPADSTSGDTVQFYPVSITGAATISIGGNTTLTQVGQNMVSNPIQAWFWSPSTGLNNTTAQSVIASPTVTTTYTMTLTDVYGTTATSSVTVTVNPFSVGLTGGTTPICSGAAGTTLTGTGATTYTWAPSGGLSATTGVSVVANPTITTIYTVTGTTGGSSATATRQVTVNASPVVGAIAGNTTLSTSITTTLTDGTVGGVWATGTPLVAAVGSGAGVVSGVSVGTGLISYTVTSSGCSTTVTTNVTVTTPTNGLSFDGVNDYVSLPSGLTSTYSNFTFEAWVYCRAATAFQRLFEFGQSTNVNMILNMFNGSGVPAFEITNTGYASGQFIIAPSSVPLNTWTHVAVTLSGSTNTGILYINGVAVASNSSMTLNPAVLGTLANNWLGRSESPSDPYFNGVLDEVQIYNIARTQPQIQGDMNCDVPQSTNLKACYRFNEGAAGGTNTSLVNALDYSGNNNCALLNNFALTGTTSNYVAGAVGSCNTITITQPGATNTGTPSVCTGLTTTLSNSVSGGTWTTSSANVLLSGTATSTVTVTGVTAGTANITYGLNCGETITQVTVNTSPTITFTAQPGATACEGASVSYVTQTGMTSYVWTYSGTSGTDYTVISGGASTTNSVTVQYFTAGPQTVSVNYTSSGCAAATATSSTPTTVQTAPKVTGVSPAVGLPGSSVTLTGTNFNTTAASNFVYFGSVAGTVTAAGATSLTVTVPQDAVYYPSISVDNNSCGLSGWANVPYLPTYNNAAYVASTVNFDPRFDLAAGVQVRGIAFGDIDGDGKADLVVAAFNSTAVKIYLNTSTSGSISAGSFGAPITITNPSSVMENLSLADMDGDGKLDIITSSVLLGANKVAVFRNTSSGVGSVTFAAAITVATSGSSFNALTVGDLDGDGRPEIIATLGTLMVYRNQSSVGSLSFSSGTSFASGSTPIAVVLADMDGDGKKDIVAGNSGSVSVLLNTSVPGTISLAAHADFTVTGNVIWAVAADIDGDGKQDVISANGSGGFFSILRNTSAGIGSAALAAAVNFTAGTFPSAIGIGDADGDGKADVYVASQGSATLSVFRNIATSGSISLSSLAAKVDFAVAGSGAGLAVGDFDGDGKTDAVTTPGSSGTSVSFFRGAPLSPITGPTQVCIGGTINSPITLSDATGTGTWSSSNSSLASVGSATGVVTGLAAGAVTITYSGSSASGPNLGNYTTYALTVTAAPTVNVTPATSVCSGGSVSLTATGATAYSWTPATTLSASTGATVSASPTVATTYTVTGTASGCGATATVTVTINPSPVITGTLLFPVGTTSQLASSPAGGTWLSVSSGVASVTSSTGIATGLSAGSSLISYSVGGCTGTQTVTVNTASSLTWYSTTGGGDYSVLTNWWSNNNNTGYQPTLFSTDATTWTFQSNMTSTNVFNVEGNVSIVAGGTFTPLFNSFTTVGGSWSNVGGTFTANSGIVLLTGANTASSAYTLSGTMTGASAFYKLIFNSPSRSYSFGSNAADVGSDFQLFSGTLTAPGANMNVTGNFTQNSGSFFVPNGGTVTMKGSGASITAASMTTSGTSCFNNLSFNAGSATTYTINNNLLLMGSFTNLNVNATMALGAHTLTVGGNWTNPGPFTTGAHNIIYNGAGIITIQGNQ